mgnify:FL=1
MRDEPTTTRVDRLAPDIFMRYLMEFLKDAERRGVDVDLKLPQSYKPVKVIYNGITTIAIFSDGQKIISRPNEGEWFDKESGLAMCIAKRVYGGRGQFLKAVEGATVQAVKSEDSCSMGWVEALNEIVNSLSRFVAESKKETDEQ